LRGEKPQKRPDCSADLTVSASIPDRYVPMPEQRMDLYRRIARIRTEEEGDDLVDELIDRYGDPPRSVNNLITVALLRARAAENGISELTQRGSALNFGLTEVDFARVSQLCGGEKYKGRLLFGAGEKPCLTLRLKKGEDVLRAAEQLLKEYAAAGENCK